MLANVEVNTQRSFSSDVQAALQASGQAAEVLVLSEEAANPYNNLLRIDSEFPYQERYGIIHNGLVLTPNSPEYQEYYKEYVLALKQIQADSKNLPELIQGVVTYTHSKYPHNLTLEPAKIIEGAQEEVMVRIESGRGTCADMALLAQYGLYQLGVYTEYTSVDGVTIKSDGKSEYFGHANLTAFIDRVPYTLELTNGSVMLQDDYDKFLRDTFDFVQGIIQRHTLETGLEYFANVG